MIGMTPPQYAEWKRNHQPRERKKRILFRRSKEATTRVMNIYLALLDTREDFTCIGVKERFECGDSTFAEVLRRLRKDGHVEPSDGKRVNMRKIYRFIK